MPRIIREITIPLTFLLVGTTCLWRGFQSPPSPDLRTIETRPVALEATASPTTATKPIESIRVGERVLGENPLRDEVDVSLPEPEQASWRLLRLKMMNSDGHELDIELLRPMTWIDEQGATVGGTIVLDLPELGAQGQTEVLAIESSPPIGSGPGQVVTGTFHHRSSNLLLNITVDGDDQPIGVTDNHPFWSEDRQQFVEACQLEVGETLSTLTGTAEITSITPRGPPEPVYNLEVHGEHVYRVANSGVLVHNSYVDDDYLYRGVSGFHQPQLDEALEGIARPRGVFDDARAHHRGRTDTSALTSWDTDPWTAIDAATDGPVGVVLRIPRSHVDSTRLRILAPEDVIYEPTEVMIHGLVEGAEVLDVYELMRQFPD